MRSLLRSVATVVATQPFYAEEIRALHMALAGARVRLPILDRLRLD